MLLLRQKFLLVFEIFHTKLSEKSILGIRNVTLWLFFNNNHLRFGCQIVTYGHHLSKNIITSQFSQFSFFLIFTLNLRFWAVSQLYDSAQKSHNNKKFLYWPNVTFNRVWIFSSPDILNRLWFELLILLKYSSLFVSLWPFSNQFTNGNKTSL